MNQADPQSFQQQQDAASELHRAQLELTKTLVGKSLKECREAGLMVPDWDDDVVFKGVVGNSLIFTRFEPAPCRVIRMEGTLSLNADGEPVLDGTIETVQDGD